MKIGILTFQWATNHGAVLQTYATWKYLTDKYKIKVEVINYIPWRLKTSLLRVLKPGQFGNKWYIYQKEQEIKKFRKNFIRTKKFFTNKQLYQISNRYDLVFAGSDQIWNPFFVESGVDKSTFTYFLDFIGERTLKYGLSVSFGCSVYPQETLEKIIPYLKRFHGISVRENSGQLILKKIGIQSPITADPTALLSYEEYVDLIEGDNCNQCFTAKCILREQSREKNAFIKDVTDILKLQVKDIQSYSVGKWLGSILRATYVVTNSFHCVMFCLKFHTPFFVILEDAELSGMNDRFISLLNFFGLEDRIVSNRNDIMPNKSISWNEIDKKMVEYSKGLKEYIDNAIIKV